MFNPNSKTYRFIQNKMMLIKNEGWNPDGDNGKGDALWRTSLSYIAYKDSSLKEGILSCFRKFKMINKKKYWYQGSRYYDRHCEDDVSRDQTILALSSLKVNGEDEILDEITNHLPYKLSRRFVMGPTLWVWIKAITGKGKFYTYLFGLLELIEFLPSVLWDKFLRKIMGWNKEYSQEWYLGVDESMAFWSKEDGVWVWVKDCYPWVTNGQRLNSNHHKKKEENKLYSMLYAAEYPEYALHLFSWMMYCSDDTFLKKILQKLGLWLAEKNNLLVRILLGDKSVTKEEIENYKPAEGYRWSTRYNGTTYSNYLKGDDSLYNTIDKDLLLRFFNELK